MNEQRPFLIFMILGVVAALAAAPVSAVSVSTAAIELVLAPGTSGTFPVTLSLPPGDPADTFTLVAAGLGQAPFDWSFTPLGAAADTGPYSARTFITFDRATVQVAPGGQAVVTATAAMPADAGEGGFYAAIAIYRAGDRAGRQAAAPVAVIPVFISTGGNPGPATGEVTGIEVTTFRNEAPDQVSTYFVNTGNRRISGAVNAVIVTGAGGTVLAREQAGPSALSIIPGQEVRFSVPFESGLPAGATRVTTRVGLTDGTVIAEQDESVDVPVGEPGAWSGSPPDPVQTQQANGFGAGAAQLVLAAGAGVIARSRKR